MAAVKLYLEDFVKIRKKNTNGNCLSIEDMTTETIEKIIPHLIISDFKRLTSGCFKLSKQLLYVLTAFSIHISAVLGLILLK